MTKLLQKGVIRKAIPRAGLFISSVFIRPKKDAFFQMILNLKQLNAFITYHHFKMETLQSALTLVKPGSYMAVLDLKDAYYSVSIAEEHRHYLRFVFMNQLVEYVALPNGLASAPRLFTKLMKPVDSTLRSKGICLVGYIDDILILADSPRELNLAVNETILLLQSLGFFIHETKSNIEPSQEVKFLGFLINSVRMHVSMTSHKADKIRQACYALLRKGPVPIRTVASMVRLMVSSFPGVSYGPPYYRQLENEKRAALKLNGHNLDAKMELSYLAKLDTQWWIKKSVLVSSTYPHASHPGHS